MSAPYMPLYVADYLGDTQHLSTEQHGAYLLLLMAMWRHDGWLPHDDTKLARIARVSSRRWHIVGPDVMELFVISDGRVTHKRLEREHQKALSISEKRSASGKRGGDAKALKTKKEALANATDLPCHVISDQVEDITPSYEGVAPPARKSTPRAELQAVLDDDHADAVLEHRQRIRSPLTARAARLLAGKLAEWPGGANQAADLMPEAGWRGFDTSWAENRKVPQRAQSPPDRPKGLAARLAERTRPQALRRP